MADATPGNINRLERQMDQLQSMSATISMEVQEVGTRQERLSSDVRDLRTQLLEYFEEDKRIQAIQTAETRLVNVRQQLETDYGHYASIRRRATGILQAVDANLVSDDVIQHTTEDLMMDAPRYWLGPALVTIAAWCRQDNDLAVRASREATNRDPSKSSLFLSLVMRRQNNENAVGWLAHYLERQKPSELSREFVVILDAVTTGAFGPSAVSGIKKTIDKWMIGIAQQPGIEDQQAAAWRTQLEGLKGPETFSYPTLIEICPIHDALIDSLAWARCHGQISSHFTAIFTRELPRSLDHEQKVDDILTSLVTNFDEEELPLRRKEIEHQAIIDTDGDMEEAKSQAERIGAALEEVLTFPELLVAASFHPEEAGTTLGTQRLAIALCKNWLVQGYDVLTAEIRSQAVGHVPIQIRDWSATVSNPPDEAALAHDLEAHCDAETEADVKARSQDPIGIGALVFGALLVVAGLANLNILMILIGLAGCAYGGYTIHKTNQDRERIRDNGDQRKQQSAAKLRDGLAELVDYRTEWNREDQKATQTREILDGLDPSGSGLTDRRQVS